MKKQSGFATVELLVVVIVLAVVAGAGYFVMHNNSTKLNQTAATTTSTAAANNVPPVTTPPAPQITSTASLSTALQVLNETSVSSNATDSNNLTTQSSGF